MDNDEAESVFETRCVQCFGRTVPILMQQSNGPCAFIAICNVLLLRGDIELSQETRRVTLNMLLSLVEKWISNPNLNTGGFFLKKWQDIPKILEGFADYVTLDVGFLNIHDFEFTLKMAIFKALGIELVHGWLPEDEATIKAVGDRSYDNLQMSLPGRACLGSDKENLIGETKEGLPGNGDRTNLKPDSSVSRTDDESLGKERGEEDLIRNFVSGRQLTDRGFLRLCEALPEEKLCVLYWGGHFSTIIKHNKTLYMLVTDTSFKDKPDYIWETVKVDGNSEFFTANFTLVQETLQVNATDITIAIYIRSAPQSAFQLPFAWEHKSFMLMNLIFYSLVGAWYSKLLLAGVCELRFPLYLRLHYSGNDRTFIRLVSGMGALRS